MGKAARFTQSNRHSVPDSPTNGVSLVGEASARRSRWKKRTLMGRDHSPATRLFQSEIQLVHTREKTRAPPNFIASLQVERDGMAVLPGYASPSGALPLRLATSSDYRSRPEPWSQGNSTNAPASPSRQNPRPLPTAIPRHRRKSRRFFVAQK